MSRLEDELRNALRQEPPPAGFTQRVLARAAVRKTTWSFAGLLGVRGLRWVMAGALALALVGAGVGYRHQREEEARGEQARAQVLLALHIAGSKLQLAQRALLELQGPGVASETKSGERAQ